MEELTKVEYSEWLRWCGYEDAMMYANPLDSDPDYLAGYAEGYAHLEMEGARNEI